MLRYESQDQASTTKIQNGIHEKIPIIKLLKIQDMTYGINII